MAKDPAKPAPTPNKKQRQSLLSVMGQLYKADPKKLDASKLRDLAIKIAKALLGFGFDWTDILDLFRRNGLPALSPDDIK